MSESQDFKHEPINYAKRGNKIIFGDIRKVKPHPLNIRHRLGDTIYGAVIEKDSFDIPGMKQQLVDGNGILEPIFIIRKDEKDENGKPITVDYVGRGNRRTIAGQELANDPTCPPVLFKALTEKVPMVILEGLTLNQEEELIEDQTQKPFLRSEVIKHIFHLRKQRWDFERIAGLLWETLGRFTGNAKKVAEVREITDPTLKREKIRTWLRGTLDNYILWGYDLGPVVQKAILLSEMLVDGIPCSEKPYVVMTKNSQKRVAALKKAKEADGTKWNGQMLVEGSEFKKQMDAFHAEDYGVKAAPTPTTAPDKMRKRTDVEGFAPASQAVRCFQQWVLGKDVPELTARDDYAAVMEAKEMVVLTYMPRLRPEFAAIMRLCFINPDPTDFQNYLESFVQTEADAAETRPNNPPDNTGVNVDGVSNAG